LTSCNYSKLIRRTLVLHSSLRGSGAQVKGRSSLRLLPESRLDACEVTVHCCSNSQESLWNLLPQDVIKSFLRKLSVRDSWACLGVSSCWASAVRSMIEFECVVHVQPRQLRSKLQALQQTSRQRPRQGRPLLDRLYTLQLSESMSVVSCAELLISLMTKVSQPLLVIMLLCQHANWLRKQHLIYLHTLTSTVWICRIRAFQHAQSRFLCGLWSWRQYQDLACFKALRR